jgi:heme ABC exporter ATP-binding subunit CcmA
MISAQKISKSFGPMRALTDVSFTLGAGEFVALMGANGAGKTTLIRILSALARPSRGKAIVAGYSTDGQAHQLRSQIGVVSHHTFLYNDLSAEENLRFYGKMYGVPGLEGRIEELLSQMELSRRRFDPVRTYSRGMQQRLALARALLHRPPVLLLDEPFTGLDIYATHLLTRFIAQLIHDQVTVLLTTHDVDYALQQAQRLLFLQKGNLIIDATAAQVRRAQLIELLSEAGQK